MNKIYNGFHSGIMILCKCFLIVEIVIAVLVVVTRYMPGIVVPTWSEETILTCMIYMAMLSAAMGLRKNAHIRMTAFDRFLPKTVVKALDLFGYFVVLIFAGIMVIEGWKFAVSMGAKGAYASMPFLSKFWLYFPVPLSGLVTVAVEIEQIAKLFSKKEGGEK